MNFDALFHQILKSEQLAEDMHEKLLQGLTSCSKLQC